MMKTDYLIIGSSAAGCNCVEGIRSIDNEGSITMISADSKIIYSRPVVAEYLTDELNKNELLYKNDTFIKKNNVDFFPETSAVAIDVKKGIVKTENNEIEYKKLFIGIGGNPIIPSELQVENKNVFTFTNLIEVSRLKKIVAKYNEITVVGAGFIGLEVAHSLSKLNKKVNLIELADAVLKMQSDSFLSDYIKTFLEKLNIKIFTRNSIKNILINDKGDIEKIVLSDEQKITSNAVISCIGVRPSLSLLQKTGIKTNRGIVVNKFLKTNKKNIYAGGDVIETIDVSNGDIKPIPLWFAAAEQGLKAGKNMAGKRVEYSGTIPMSPLKFLDIPGLSTGDVTFENDENITYKVSRPEKVYKKFFIKNNLLKGYILLNDLNNAGIFTKMIKNKIEISDNIRVKLKNDTFNLADIPDDIIRADYEF